MTTERAFIHEDVCRMRFKHLQKFYVGALFVQNNVVMIIIMEETLYPVGSHVRAMGHRFRLRCVHTES